MTLKLAPKIVARRRARGTAGPIAADATATGSPPQGEPLRQLEIAETRQGDDLVYQFDLQVPDLGLYERFESKPIRADRTTYVNNLYKLIENRWLSSRGDERDFQEELRAFGVELLEELVPEELQAILWTNRKRLSGVMATCTEPFIPWELVHLKKPGSRGLPKETAFLGQMGLVRWLLGRWPPERLRIRPGKARYIIPDYPDPDWALPETRGRARLPGGHLRRHRGRARPAQRAAAAAEARRLRPPALRRPRPGRGGGHLRRADPARGAHGGRPATCRTRSAPARSRGSRTWRTRTARRSSS